jgi:hypothetical protein
MILSKRKLYTIVYCICSLVKVKSFPRLWLITGFLSWRVLLVVQELVWFIFIMTGVASGTGTCTIHFYHDGCCYWYRNLCDSFCSQVLIFCVACYGPKFVFSSFFCWPLYGLSFPFMTSDYPFGYNSNYCKHIIWKKTLYPRRMYRDLIVCTCKINIDKLIIFIFQWTESTCVPSQLDCK